MIRINLLPHREERRKQRRQQFFLLAVLMLVSGAGVWFLGHGLIERYIVIQDGKNAFLKSEIAKLDTEIAEISRLREQTNALLSRKQVIESLQTHRTETVQIFSEVARRLPEGVYLKSLKQTGLKINLTGYAQSNARVSTLMRNLDSSQVLEKPELVEAKVAIVNNRRVSEFNLNVGVKRAGGDASGKAQGSLPAAGAAGSKP
ncbi:MAG: PilN domain-containing protein [Zoogloea sp.]|nr:PilN domain-containing protein [Zoogloea sp.]